MKLNFERTPLHFLLLALDADNGRVCGFSILSQRSGVANPHYTQLLSAVTYAYRERGVYTGLSQLLAELLPGDSLLLNITHADNYAMRRAYQKSGRVHHADTLVLRRIFGADAL
jgi:arginine/ornithine N-succinyltransferase beta subunit